MAFELKHTKPLLPEWLPSQSGFQNLNLGPLVSTLFVSSFGMPPQVLLEAANPVLVYFKSTSNSHRWKSHIG
jgi:hypothetical protein